ncbi:MAG: ferrous iron transport protein B [Bdellovibrionales bacterium]|nr:ferrous iron transport protein B [Bdellovibrionales bacterium]MBT3526328.1 ferrous iron transport protein B [Bdellovibrionales bacterium]MBT7670672.1 ferrous iron transport protein B [Bdellovibrionales bacterium]
MKKKVVIVGNPNSGKSILFNNLANTYSNKSRKVYSIVANYPYTTVEAASADLTIDGQEFELFDTPGLTSLTAISEDELVTRDLIIKDKPDVIIQLLNSTKLEKSLLLTSQLMELGTPIILVLNFIDETHKKGIWINFDNLERLLGLTVVEAIATQKQGLEQLAYTITQVGSRDSEARHKKSSGIQAVSYKRSVESGIATIEKCFNQDVPSKAILMLLLTGDKQITSWVEEKHGSDIVAQIQKSLSEDGVRHSKNLPNIILQDRVIWVESVIERVITEAKMTSNTISDKIGHYSRHPFWGWPILAGAMYITYLLVGKLAANQLVGFFEDVVFHPLYELLGGAISSDFLREFLVGDYGILSTGLGNALATAMPILTMFFLVLNIMEDSGYFTNLCILVSRFTRRLGLSGQSILPLMLGFGCKTMATLSTKILDSKRERYIAIFLIAFAIPCSPQMGLIMGILAAHSFTGFIIVFGVLLLIEFLAGVFLNSLLKEEDQTDFILEIPPIRLPRVKDVGVKLYYRIKWFMVEIPPLFMVGAFILFVLDQSGALVIIKQALTPVVVSFLSLPIETVDAFLLCLVKHEAGAVQLLTLTDNNLLSFVQVVVSLIIITSLGPCVANLMAIIKQIKLQKALVMRVVILMLSILTGGAVNWSFKLVEMINIF